MKTLRRATFLLVVLLSVVVLLPACTATGRATGAVGAAVGALADRDNPWRGAAIGGAAGAVLGDTLETGQSPLEQPDLRGRGQRHYHEEHRPLHVAPYSMWVAERFWNGYRWRTEQVEVTVRWHERYRACGYFGADRSFHEQPCTW